MKKKNVKTVLGTKKNLKFKLTSTIKKSIYILFSLSIILLL
jgi:hypothetical protein